VIPPPSIQDSPAVEADYLQESQDQSDSADDEDDEEDSEKDDVEPIKFVPDECLFCSEKCGTFDDNMEHMRATHGLIIPYQNHLTVDLETLVWFMHLVIHGYRECISCGKRRRTAGAVQHHMVATSHCRPNLSSDIAEFYKDLPEDLMSPDHVANMDEESMRLSSGKIITHRSQMQTQHAPNRQRIQPTSSSQQLPSSSTSGGKGSSALDRKDRKAAALDLQLARMSANDQQSLAHLPTSEQRALLATRKKQLDKARREEVRARSKVERMSNQTLMKHFKNDVPGPKLG
jgi:pre-60S factor REI1